MPKVEVDVETSVAPERVRAALLDFSDRRPAIWPGIEPSLYKVFSVDATSAEIQEGTKAPGGSVWAREHYDWSAPDRIRWTVMDSNFCRPGSYVEARISPRAGGGSRVHLVWNRSPSSLSGAIATAAIVALRGGPFARSFRMGLERLEAGIASGASE
ncbi:MAG: SRPBCC family protein [Chloroflexota bacterium]